MLKFIFWCITIKSYFYKIIKYPKNENFLNNLKSDHEKVECVTNDKNAVQAFKILERNQAINISPLFKIEILII